MHSMRRKFFSPVQLLSFCRWYIWVDVLSLVPVVTVFICWNADIDMNVQPLLIIRMLRLLRLMRVYRLLYLTESGTIAR